MRKQVNNKVKNVRVASEMTVSHDAFFEQHPADGEIQKYEYTSTNIRELLLHYHSI